MPTWSSSSSVRVRAALRRRPRWVCSTSPICCSMVCTGLSEVIGSWKIIDTSLPRTSRSARASAASRSRPLNRTLPDAVALGGSSRSTDRAVTDLPEPLSPTSATVSPGPMSNDTPSTAAAAPKRTDRSRTESSGAVTAPAPRLPCPGAMSCANYGSVEVPSRTPSRERLARIKGVAHRLADEDQQRQHDRDRQEAGDAQPR